MSLIVSCDASQLGAIEPQAAGTQQRNTDLSSTAFVDELASRIDELRSHLRTNVRLLCAIKMDVSLVFRRLSENLQAAPFIEQRSLQDVRVTCAAVRELEISLGRHVQELDVLKRNCARTVDDLKRRFREDTAAVTAAQARQDRIQREARDSTERKAHEPWIISWLLSPFRAKAPTQEEVGEAGRNVEGARVHLQEDEAQLSGATEELRGTLMRRIELNRFLARLGSTRVNVEDILEAIDVQNKPVDGESLAPAAPPVEPPKDYRFGVTIPNKFFDECVRLSRSLSADIVQQVQARLAETSAKNQTGFVSNDAATTELHHMLGDIRRILQGTDNDLVRFILRAFAEMVEDVI
jgi:hypothetical protein